MKKVITLNIPEPCHENWNVMTPNEKGRHCMSCNKTVVDFTNKSDEQVIKLVENETSLCGRFKTEQLNRKLVIERKEKNNYLSWVASGLFAFLTIGNHDLHAQGAPRVVQNDTIKIPRVKGKIARSVLQEKVITGTLTMYDMPLPGATVIVKGTTKGAQTDFDGNYSIKAKIGDVLEFSYVGAITQKITVGHTNVINIVLEEDKVLLQSIVVGGEVSVNQTYCTGSVVSIRPDDLTPIRITPIDKRLQRKNERKAKRERIQNGTQKRTVLGQFLYGIKRLFSKK